jgi:hypothetical protein
MGWFLFIVFVVLPLVWIFADMWMRPYQAESQEERDQLMREYHSQLQRDDAERPLKAAYWRGYMDGGS